MSTATELGKNWEGKLVDGKFTLRKWLGGSDHSAVFLTELRDATPQKLAAKLISAENPDQAGAQLRRWADATKLKHSHLIQLFEYGRIDTSPILYVLSEYAEENLAEVIAQRPLSSTEALEMLRPAAEALQFLHQAGYAHGRIKPSNFMAVAEQLKLSADQIQRIDEDKSAGSIAARTGLQTAVEAGSARGLSGYSAPEVARTGFTPESDIWSLGMTLLAVLTQTEPTTAPPGSGQIQVPETISQPIRGIVQRCLESDPAKRSSASEILGQLSGRRAQPSGPPSQMEVNANSSRVDVTTKNRPLVWVPVPAFVVVVLLLWWMGSKILGHHPPPASEASTQIAQPDTQAETARIRASRASPKAGLVPGSVRDQTSPDVSRTALHTITGRLKVAVQVSVDAGGNVTTAKLISPGPSKYFSQRALAAARLWKFNPPRVNGQAAGSQWLLRFQFTRSSVQVVPSEVKP
jgi:TonB family protein